MPNSPVHLHASFVPFHPLTRFFLFLFLLTRIYGISVSIVLGYFDPRRMSVDLIGVSLASMFAPELHGLHGLASMLMVWLMSLIGSILAFKYPLEIHDTTLLFDELARNWCWALGFSRYVLAAGIVAVLLHVSSIVHQVVPGSASILLAVITTWHFATFIIPPLLNSVVVPFAEYVLTGAVEELPTPCESELLIDALPVLEELDVTREDDCAICFESFGEVQGPVVKLTGCGHVFCKECIASWIYSGHSVCPMCRHNFMEDLVTCKTYPLVVAFLLHPILVGTLIWDTAKAYFSEFFPPLPEPTDGVRSQPGFILMDGEHPDGIRTSDFLYALDEDDTAFEESIKKMREEAREMDARMELMAQRHDMVIQQLDKIHESLNNTLGVPKSGPADEVSRTGARHSCF